MKSEEISPISVHRYEQKIVIALSVSKIVNKYFYLYAFYYASKIINIHHICSISRSVL